MQRDIRDRVLAMSKANEPTCGRQSITTTEVLDLHPDGRVATERWTVEACGRRTNYVVSFSGNARGTTFTVRPESR